MDGMCEWEWFARMVHTNTPMPPDNGIQLKATLREIPLPVAYY